MKLIKAARAVLRMAKQTWFPSEYDHILRKWWADGGDDAFRYAYPLTERSFVMDLGGYKGQWASDIFARYQCRIAVFEPVKGFAANIRARFEHNRLISTFAIGLGASTRRATIGVCMDGSSIFKRAAIEEYIEIVDVHDWLRNAGEKTVDLLKINIEGGEYELLERLIETDDVSSIGNIQVQFHKVDDNSKARMNEIRRILAHTHIPTYQYDFVWDNWTRK